MDVSNILHGVDAGNMALPEFQRGYVWNREQVRRFMDSLYRRHPVGSLLVWLTKTEEAEVKGDQPLAPGVVKLILDGQQRVTTLYGIIKGQPPSFFQGDERAFTKLMFNVATEAFEFQQPIKMRDDPMWIDVTELMKRGVGDFIATMMELPQFKEDAGTHLGRLTRLYGIKEVPLHMEEVSGEDKTVDVVVEIFNNVNSGGTKLSKGDLALAKVCAEWPDARNEMRRRLDKWSQAGFSFRLEWLLRCINSILTGEALFSALRDVRPPAFKKGLEEAEKAIDNLLNIIASRLGLDHDLVLGSRYSFPLLARYLVERGHKLSDPQDWDKILYWYIQTFLWGRYAGSTETVLNQDLALIEDVDGALERLIAQMHRIHSPHLSPEDFAGWSRGARFYPLLYMLTRVSQSRDLCSPYLELSKQLLGKGASLQLHHVFPKALLYQHGYGRTEVNALANFTFLTQTCNLQLLDRPPANYLTEVADGCPEAIASHWIPPDPELWRVENYREFLAARRTLLAEAANKFLDSLLQGSASHERVARPVVGAGAGPVSGGVVSAGEEAVLAALREWIISLGLPPGDFGYELRDSVTGELLAILDLAWPDGLQEGLSQPVALLIDEDEETGALANREGFRYFTDSDSFRAYVQSDILALSEDVA